MSRTDLTGRSTWQLNRAIEVCSQKIRLSRNPREAVTLAAGRPKPAVLPRASQSSAAATSYFHCLSAETALEGTSPLPETAANHLSHSTEGLFPHLSLESPNANPPWGRKQQASLGQCRGSRGDAGLIQTVRKIHFTAFPYLNFGMAATTRHAPVPHDASEHVFSLVTGRGDTQIHVPLCPDQHGG